MQFFWLAGNNDWLWVWISVSAVLESLLSASTTFNFVLFPAVVGMVPVLRLLVLLFQEWRARLHNVLVFHRDGGECLFPLWYCCVLGLIHQTSCCDLQLPYLYP